MTYFDWLISFTQFTYTPRSSRDDDILHKLFMTPYVYTVERDVNRACEGMKLREQYGAQFAMPCEVATNECSILEMMVALAIRCDATVSLEGDANPQFWFETMWDSMGFKQPHRNVDAIIGTFNRGAYKWNGDGGLFYIPNLDPHINMPSYELWAQMNLYLNYMFG